jgi:2-polyprenyl-3-methyl-5-hydroxy-6-metoxy-1,4-benzoquinol methylase
VPDASIPREQTALASFVSGFPERYVPEVMANTPIELEHLARYWWASALVRGRTVLDAGCGTGYGSEILARAGAKKVIGVDLADSVIAAARRSVESGPEFHVGDVRRLTFGDGHFDVVICFEMIEHVEEQDSVLDELSRVLRKDGVLAISSPNKDVSGQHNPHHVREFAPEELRLALLNRFHNVRLYSQRNWIASLILCEREGRASEPSQTIREAMLHHEASLRPGEELYAVALASRAALPDATQAGFVALADLERETELLAEIYRSLSWRVTGPLRALSARVHLRSRPRR